MYTSSYTGLEWLGDGSLFESDSNKRQEAKMGPLFESPPRPLLKKGLLPLFSRYGFQVGDLKRCIFHLTRADQETGGAL